MLERVNLGELELRLQSRTPKTKPFRDHNGKWCLENENSLILDPRFPTDDPRHTAAKTHRHITDTGEAGASGKHDPKTITTPEGVKY
jgi:hypothetical protein